MRLIIRMPYCELIPTANDNSRSIQRLAKHLTMSVTRYLNASDTEEQETCLLEPNGLAYRFRTGLLQRVKMMANTIGMEIESEIDERGEPPTPDDKMMGKKVVLRDYQQVAMDRMIKHPMGVLCAATGAGKTVMAAYMIAQRAVHTLFLVHTKDLLYQAKEAFENILGEKVGVIGDGEYDVKHITVATMQTLSRYIKSGEINQIRDAFGMVITDECLPSNAIIETEDGMRTIKQIVDKKYGGKIKSLDDQGRVVWKHVVGWFVSKKAKPWLTVANGRKFRRLRCTGDHEVYCVKNIFRPTLSKYPAKDIVGMHAICSPRIGFNRNIRGDNLFNQDQIQIVLGSMLGDGCVDTYGRFKLTNGEAQLEYLKWKLELLGGGSVRVLKSGYAPSHLVYQAALPINEQTRELRRMYTPKKQLSRQYADLIGAKALAIWFMDDGSVNWYSTKMGKRPIITFHTEGFSRDSVNELCRVLRCYGMNPSIGSYRNFLIIRLSANDSEEFIEMIRPYGCPAMSYKFGDKCGGYVWDIHRLDFSTIEINTVEQWTENAGSKRNDVHRSYANYYDITVQDTHRFFANGWLVSNCHHVPASTFFAVTGAFSAYYVYGLSATPDRKDGSDMMIEAAAGPIIAEIETDSLMKSDDLCPVVVRFVDIPAQTSYSPAPRFAVVSKYIVNNLQRNQTIARLTKEFTERNETALILVNQVKHANNLKALMPDAVIIQGSDKSDVRQDIWDRLRNKDIKVVISTVAKEGVDVPSLDMCMNAFGGTDNRQVIGRVLRNSKGKKMATFLDMVDWGHIRTLQNSRARLKQAKASKEFIVVNA